MNDISMLFSGMLLGIIIGMVFATILLIDLVKKAEKRLEAVCQRLKKIKEILQKYKSSDS